MEIAVINGDTIYSGPGGIIAMFNMGKNDAPKRVIDSRITMGIDEDEAKEIAEHLLGNGCSVVCAPIDSITTDDDDEIYDIENACIVITTSGDRKVYTNIPNPETFRLVFTSLANAIQKGSWQKLSDNDAPAQPGLWSRFANNDMSDIENEIRAMKTIPQELKNKVLDIYHSINEAQANIDKCISPKLFAEGLVAVTCSSKKEYKEMKKYFMDQDFTVSKTVNEKEWDDLCKYVYAESLPEDDIILVHASFHVPKSADRVIPYHQLKHEMETLQLYIEQMDAIKDEAIALKDSIV